VLTDESTPCASEALQALFAGTPVQPCVPAPTPAILRPAPLPPLRLAQVSPARGYRGVPGRTLHAVALTLSDLIRRLALALTVGGTSEAGALKLHIGGLRAGWAELTARGVSLHGYSYMPGVTISGTIGLETEDLTVGGASGAHGTLRGAPHQSLTGILGGHHVTLPASSLTSAAIVVGDARESSHLGAGDSALRGGVRVLARLFGSGRR
jgi:hypothetical protein